MSEGNEQIKEKRYNRYRKYIDTNVLTRFASDVQRLNPIERLELAKYLIMSSKLSKKMIKTGLKYLASVQKHRTRYTI
jgi:hypothetical protein